MKKVFLFFAVAMVFGACAPKAAEENTVVEDSAVVVEEVVVDSVVADSTVVETVAE
ncbi:MAG: hypothetical protein JXR27_12665 [Paludibacteraceae bacterium]|nr:hypothetical protein [Paludibacteraceae bacterium]